MHSQKHADEAPKPEIPDRRFYWACVSSSKADGRLAGSGQELPVKLVANVSTALVTASHSPVTLQGWPNFLFGWLAKVSRWVVRWVGLSSRCELYRETGNPRVPCHCHWGFAKRKRLTNCGCLKASAWDEGLQISAAVWPPSIVVLNKKRA
eukprot:1156828-Pelagomonas_calceolata.AAC.3